MSCSNLCFRYPMDRAAWRTSSRNRQLKPLAAKKVWMRSSFSSEEGAAESREDPMFQEPALNDEVGRSWVTQGCWRGIMGRRWFARRSPL